MVYLLLAAYVVFTFWGSLLGSKENTDTPEGYFLANRNLRTLTLLCTMMATNISAFYFLGFAGEGYRVGYVHYFVLGFGSSLAGLTLYIVGTSVWKLGKARGYITPGELIYGETNSRTLSYLFSGTMCFYTLPYLSIQIIGGGYILENLSGGEIPYALAVLLLTLFTISYVVVGGMESVAKTDVKQGVLMVVMMFAAVILISGSLGGIGAANRRAFELAPDLFSIHGQGNRYTPQQWISLTLFWAFANPMIPQLFMRLYVARNVEHFRQMSFFYGLAPFVLHILPVCIGVRGVVSFPGLMGKEVDRILPMMLEQHTYPWFAALIMIGAIAAFMSTLDSQLLALSTMVTRDFVLPLRKTPLSLKKQAFLGKALVVLFAVIGCGFAFYPFDTLFEIVKLAFAGFAVLFPIVLAAVKLGGLDPRYGIASVVVGQLLIMAFFCGWLPSAWLFGFEAYLLALTICFAICLWGHRVAKKRVRR